jgi:hypothetical protein
MVPEPQEPHQEPPVIDATVCVRLRSILKTCYRPNNERDLQFER